jgi:hypothetical protein
LTLPDICRVLTLLQPSSHSASPLLDWSRWRRCHQSRASSFSCSPGEEATVRAFLLLCCDPGILFSRSRRVPKGVFLVTGRFLADRRSQTAASPRFWAGQRRTRSGSPHTLGALLLGTDAPWKRMQMVWEASWEAATKLRFRGQRFSPLRLAIAHREVYVCVVYRTLVKRHAFLRLRVAPAHWLAAKYVRARNSGCREWEDTECPVVRSVVNLMSRTCRYTEGKRALLWGKVRDSGDGRARVLTRTHSCRTGEPVPI